jgi:uncharacterized protein YlxW (UPF0749 family)
MRGLRRRRQNRIALTVVAAILGFLVVVQLKSQAAAPGLTGQTAQELTVLVANLSTRNDQLRDEISTLEAQAADLTNGRTRGESSVDAVRSDLARVKAWIGLAPVRGPGVEVTVAGPLPGEGVEDLLNELRNAGAEAVAVEDVRIVPGAVVAGAAGSLTLGERGLSNPLHIRAIGTPSILTGSLTRVGGPIAQLAARFPDVLIEVDAVDSMDLPATERTLVPINGQPHL